MVDINIIMRKEKSIKRKHYKKRVYKYKKCKFCKNKFLNRKSNFCSVGCRLNYLKIIFEKKSKYICNFCGNKVKPTQIRYYKNEIICRFCKNKLSGKPIHKSIISICKTYGCAFKHKSNVNRQYCSPKCVPKDKAGRKPLDKNIYKKLHRHPPQALARP